jgi:hypothetical protein
MPGNIGISFERLVGACVENVETVSDSQELMTALVKTSLCDQPNRALDGFKAAHKTENDRKEETKCAIGESKWERMRRSPVVPGPRLFFAGEDDRRSTEAAPAPRIIKKTVIGDALSVWRTPGEIRRQV